MKAQEGVACNGPGVAAEVDQEYDLLIRVFCEEGTFALILAFAIMPCLGKVAQSTRDWRAGMLRPAY